MIKDLERSEFDEDKDLARKLSVFVEEMPRINPREKVVYEEHRARLEQAKKLQAELAKQKESRAGQEQAPKPSTQSNEQQPKQPKPKAGHKPKL